MGWEKKKSRNKPSNTADSSNIIHVKSKLGEEFRRFGLKRTEEPHRFQNFKALVRQMHGLLNTPFRICYIDPSDKGLLPITNNYNFEQALKTSERLLRIIVERKRDVKNWKQLKILSINSMCGLRAGKPESLTISSPHDCHQVSAIIDVDIVPATHRRVLLHKHDSDKPLGFAIRDGVSSRDSKKQPGIFISRIVPGGLAESSGLFEVNDEVVEVNGVDVAGMDLNQVTDLMVANCPNLIITLIPVNQHTLVFPRGGHPSRTRPLCSNPRHSNYTNTSDDDGEYDQDEIVDLTGITLDDSTNCGGSDGGSANGDDVVHV